MFSFLFAERKSFIVKVPCLSPGTVCSSVLNAWAVPHPSILCCSSSGSIPVVCKKAPNLWQADWRNNRHFQQQKPALPARSISGTTISCTKGWYLTNKVQSVVTHLPFTFCEPSDNSSSSNYRVYKLSVFQLMRNHFCVTTWKSEKEKFLKKQWWCETLLNSLPDSLLYCLKYRPEPVFSR